MKTKISLLVVFALFLFAGLQAQSHTEYTVIGGLNIANFSGDDMDDMEDSVEPEIDVSNKMGAHLGIAAAIPLSKAFDLRGEVAVSMNGSIWEYEDFATLTHSMFVAHVPVSVLFNVPLPKSKVKPYVGAGLSLGMPVYSHWYLEPEEGDDEDGEYDSREMDVKLSQFVLGYQFNFGINYNEILLELRIDKSITPVLDERRIDETFYSNTKLLLGYHF